MQREIARAEKRVDVGEQRLILVERNEFHFHIDDKRRVQTLARALEHHHLAPLNVDFEKIDAGGFRNVVEPGGSDLMCFHHLEIFGETLEMLRQCEIGLEKR